MPPLPSSCGQHPHLSAQHDRATGKRFDATHLARDCEGRNGLSLLQCLKTLGRATRALISDASAAAHLLVQLSSPPYHRRATQSTQGAAPF